ncbi:MAG: sce7726 family protein [Ignavibacteriales bacterium]|nr:sce7726 family protein [Ignavibacteriales bacterium]
MLRTINQEQFSIDNIAVTTLARSYNILSSQVQLKNLLSSVLLINDINKFTKYELHNLFNEIIYKYYNGETTVKALLVKYFIRERVVAAFEIKSNKSRIDFLRINGSTMSYEIKSELDTLLKLKKQVNDYQKLFDYNYVVIDEKHLTNAREIIPSQYGIISVCNGKLSEILKAKKNIFICASSQLNLFTKKELEYFFEGMNCDKNKILKKYSPLKLNEIFRAMLKDRYEKKWGFLLEHRREILPIDYQFFFNNNILPSIIYT